MNIKMRKNISHQNRGWGWAIVGGTVLINAFNQSVLSVFGLLFGEHLLNMGHSTSSAALITNLNSLVLNFSGFFIGPAIKNFSPRSVALFGSVLSSIGLMLCSLSTQLWHIIFAYSLLLGIGLGLLSPSSFIIINSYFTTRRGSAVGIGLAGSGIGQMIMPQIVRILLDNYGFRTTVLILGALALHGVVGALLFKPIKVNKKPVIVNNLKEINLLIEMDKNIGLQTNENNSISKKIGNSRIKSLYKKILKQIFNALDLELLKDPVFWSICIGMSMVYTATINFSMIWPYFLQISAGLSRKDAAICMSTLAGADIISRLSLPFLTDKLKLSPRVIFLFGTFGLLCSRTVLAGTSDFATLILMAAICGSVKAATVINNSLVISEHNKPDKLAGGLGLNMISKGIMVITIGQLLGLLQGLSKSYTMCLYAQNILLVVVICLWTPELIYKYMKNYKLQRDSTESSIL